jgi:hypothetical protein
MGRRKNKSAKQPDRMPLSPPPCTQAEQKKKKKLCVPASSLRCPSARSACAPPLPPHSALAPDTKRALASSLLHPSARSARAPPPAHSAPAPDARCPSPASAPGSTIDDQRWRQAMAATTNRYSSPRPPLLLSSSSLPLSPVASSLSLTPAPPSLSARRLASLSLYQGSRQGRDATVCGGCRRHRRKEIFLMHCYVQN